VSDAATPTTGIVHHSFDVARDVALSLIANGAKRVWVVRIPWQPGSALPHTGGCYVRTGDVPPLITKSRRLLALFEQPEGETHDDRTDDRDPLERYIDQPA
jgi:hypothetical protein